MWFKSFSFCLINWLVEFVTGVTKEKKFLMFLVLQEWFEDLNEKSVNIIVNSSIRHFILIVVALSYLIGIAYNPGNV